ncbi:MAG: DUF3450 domain-containing protein [Oceanococcaceae bacterium]
MNNPKKHATMPKTRIVVLLAAAGVLATSPVLANTLDSSLNLQQRIDADARQTQVAINQLDDEAEQLLTEYRVTTRETDSLKRYNRQLEKQIASQVAEMESIQRQLEQINDVSREVVPMMLRMIDTLEQFVELDLPFLLGERTRRVNDLRETMDRADVSTSEKYRRIVEAYQTEMEFGRTIEAYQGELALDGTNKVVDFLRVGRVALMYQTLDAGTTGYFDTATRSFVADNSYKTAVRDGLRIARKQTAPDLLIVPVAAPAKQ